MAKIIRGLLKGASGTLGSIVLRVINGETYVCKRPVYRKTKDPSVLGRRKKFAVAVKLSKCINDIPELKQLWRNALKGKMTTHNSIVRANYDKVSADGITGIPTLTPDSFCMNSSISEYDDSNRVVKIEFSNEITGFIRKNETRIKAVGILSLSNSKDSNDEIRVFKVESESYAVQENGNIKMDIRLDCRAMQELDNYYDGTVYFALITFDNDGSVVNSVSTFVELIMRKE